MAGAWLGGVSGVVFFTTVDAIFWFGLNVPGTIITVMVKGIMAGYLAGLMYKLLEKRNRYLAIMASAVVAPVVNTGIFLIGCLIFFIDAVSSMAMAEGMSIGGYLIIFFVGLNFVFELIVNVVLSPAIARVLDIAEKTFKKTIKKAPATEPKPEARSRGKNGIIRFILKMNPRNFLGFILSFNYLTVTLLM